MATESIATAFDALPSGAGTSGSRRLAKRSLVILVLAVALGLVEAVQIYLGSAGLGRPITAYDAITSTMPSWLILAALGPGILMLADRFRLGRGAWRTGVVVHIAGAVTFALLHLAGTQLAGTLMADKPESFMRGFSFLGRIYFVLDALTYCLIVGAVHALHYYGQYRDRELTASQLQASLTQARLQALRGQLNPHFLFNTLNAVSVLALKGEQEAVVEILSRLSELLRLSLDDKRMQEVPLAQELEFLDKYLEIQRIRFADRLTIEKDVDPDTLDAMVPSMLLQPLVENAVVHGVGVHRGAGTIAIHVARQNGMLRLQVRDTGPGFESSAAKDRGEGIGLGNTRARLEQLYGTAHRFEIGNAPGGGAAATITIPFRPLTGERPAPGAAERLRGRDPGSRTPRP